MTTSQINTENLILTQLTRNGFSEDRIAPSDHVLKTDKGIIDLLIKEFPEFSNEGERKEYSAFEIKDYINFITKSEFPVGIIIFALYKIGVPYRKKGNNSFYFSITPEVMDKYCFTRVRARIGCDCKVDLDNSYFNVRP